MIQLTTIIVHKNAILVYSGEFGPGENRMTTSPINLNGEILKSQKLTLTVK